jgi:hypothetical protein
VSDDLKRVYENQGALDRYYDGQIPRDLFRGRKQGSSEDLMQPTLIGFYRRETPRLPDVLVTNDKGKSPQFRDDARTALVVEDANGTVTADIVRNADKYMVKGCRTVSGDYRGVSVFDRKNTRLPFDWFKLPKGTNLPDALACTRDGPLESASAVHYTVAPKDDMSLSLFLQHLKALAASAVKE